jgi:ribosomal protein S18 acetylase RimI-like enzyme
VLAPGLRFRAAARSDLSEVIATLAEASRWEMEKGFPHPWPIPFPEDRLRPALERGEIYLVADDRGRTAGTVTLQWDDLPFWGPRPPDAGYVHRLAVRREFAGRGIGGQMLLWAEREIRARDRRFVRLDCLRDAVRLHEFYRSYGFRWIGEVTVGGLDCTLFEKDLRAPDRPSARGERG